MKNNLFYGLILLSLNYSCTQLHSQEKGAIANPQDTIYVGQPTYFNDDLVREDTLYTSIIRINKQKNNDYNLSVEMILKKDAYFVSPNAQGNFLGKFTIVLTEPETVETSGTIVESPLSSDKAHNKGGLTSFVRENTNYKQTLKVLTTENFEAAGYIQFTIEPRCTLEKIPFVLSFENGRLRIKMNGC